MLQIFPIVGCLPMQIKETCALNPVVIGPVDTMEGLQITGKFHTETMEFAVEFVISNTHTTELGTMIVGATNVNDKVIYNWIGQFDPNWPKSTQIGQSIGQG